ncbi:DUF1883 domain-containing protein [Pararhizobium sp. LjRoot238]|uniref:DUF1883 domain-containing protein n=1 Tax=Pararhizobium sp. LjRoot238 TaxID=3342293 RepID=UPI003ED0D407
MTKLKFSFTHYDLKQQRGGVTIEITLSAVANVRLMTENNFALYKQAMKHQFVGGVARKSPIRLTIPQSGHWHVVVDMEGHHGQSDSSIRIIETAAPPRFQSAS